MTKDLEIQLDEGDVTIEPIVEMCECEQFKVTHFVMVDYRSAGMKVGVGRYCLSCATIVSDRIRKGLPIAKKPLERCEKTPWCLKVKDHEDECDDIPF